MIKLESMVHPLQAKMAQKTKQLADAGRLRQRRVVGAGLIDFSHNDYLGLASCEPMRAAAAKGAERYGVGAKASPLVSGYSQAHQALEQALCQATGHQACLLFCSGFSANSALIETLFDSDNTVVADKLIHASVIDGIKHSGAKLKRFLHNDIESAQRILTKLEPTVVLTESTFSMDGDRAPLNELSALCKQHGSWLIVDDAHGFGITGNGIQVNCNKLSAVSADIADIQVITFGKALGCQGAAVLGSKQVIDYLVANARHYIYSTALSPANAYVALAAINYIQATPTLIDKLNNNIALFRSLYQQSDVSRQYLLADSATPIQPIIIGADSEVVALANKLSKLGFVVGAIRSPTVPKGAARLRITLSATHTSEQITNLVDALSLSLS
ncbi:8-amino-7-oxononanoate synthase [Shewanella sp. WXL01]|uniref:aminotransferase class I/II-fold pyridoxal phosphate-dependent enzyme n=1 Tax=Shewanella sp. WXL01 TaxID=2709721 RepID=UPI001FD94B3B|nr:8-amino-7-oxononanoate synthase [Shewanella sp. WXL01]